MLRLCVIFLVVALFVLKSEVICLETALLCNKVCLNESIAQTSKCKISKFKDINFSISLPEWFYQETGTINLESFEVYMKGFHTQQQDLEIDLIHGNITFRLADWGKNGIANFDVTISDDTTQTLDSQLFGLNCKCTIKPTGGNMRNEFNKNILLNEAYTLKISDFDAPANGTFEQWCISKFCYEKITQNPTINPTRTPSLYPTKSPNTNPPKVVNVSQDNNYLLFNTIGIIIIVAGLIVIVIIIAFCCFCYKCHVTKQRTTTQTQASDIISISKPVVTLVTKGGFNNNNQNIIKPSNIQSNYVEKMETSIENKATVEVNYSEGPDVKFNYLNDELIESLYESSKEGKVKQTTDGNIQMSNIEEENNNDRQETRRPTVHDTHYR